MRSDLMIIYRYHLNSNSTSILPSHLFLSSHHLHLTPNTTFQGSVLDENKEDNVHILDQTLFLSSVTKENSGDYLCTVTNQAGTTTSNTVTITVPGERKLPLGLKSHS